MRSLALVVLAACGSSSPPVGETPKWAEATATTPTAARAACIPRSDDDTRIEAASALGTSVQFCIGTARAACFAYDVATQALTRLAAAPAPRTPRSAYVLAINPTLDVCGGDTCKSLAPKVLGGMSTIRAATNPSGTLAVVLLGDGPAGRGYAEIWDVEKTRRIASFKYARGDFRCGDVAMLGDTILLSTSTCKQPGARGTLYTRRGRKLANVGGADFGIHGNAHVQLDKTTYAFLEENALQIAIQDVVKGKVKKTISLAPLFEGAAAKMGDPGESALVRLDNGTLVVITGAPVAGTMAVVDPATGTIDVVRPPGC